MNKSVADYLSDNNSPDEQRMNTLALFQGMRDGFQSLLERIARYHELLELDLKDNSAAKMYVEQSSSSLTTLSGLLTAFDPASERADIYFEALDLRVVVEAMVNRHNKTAAHAVAVDISSLADQEGYVLGNLFLLQQAILDLLILMNAADKSSTPLRVTGEHEIVDSEAALRCGLRLPGGDYMALTFRYGHAAAPDAEPKLITVGKQLLRMPSELYARLLYVAGVIAHHKGGLFFIEGGTSAEPAVGCVVYLPTLKNRVAMYSDSAGVKESPFRGTETILLVDDEDIIWDVVIDMLQNMGYMVILAADGQDCVEIYRDNPGEIDLVLLDMVMPRMNGHEAFFELQKIDPDVKVLLSSGYVNEDDARDVLNAGAAGFLQKPYRMLDLARRIREILE